MNHAAAAGLPQEERDRIIRERNWTGEERMTAEGFEAIVAPAPEADVSAPARGEPEDLRAELDDAKREIDALQVEITEAKKPTRGRKAKAAE